MSLSEEERFKPWVQGDPYVTWVPGKAYRITAPSPAPATDPSSPNTFIAKYWKRENERRIWVETVDGELGFGLDTGNIKSARSVRKKWSGGWVDA